MSDSFGADDFGRRDYYGLDSAKMAKNIGVAVAAIIAFAGIYVWFFCRIQVDQGEFVPLVKKTGENMTNDMLLVGVDEQEFKGPRYEILKEGRHFRNPYYWWWPKPMKATLIPDLKIGILTRKYGKPLPLGQVIARKDDEKGIVAEPLRAGRHYVNLWAYEVEILKMVKLDPGYMGVVTLRVGDPPENPKAFVMKKGERGTQPYLLPPGTHPAYSNPYVHEVTSIDVRSQKFEMDKYGLTFPSKYGFDIKVEGTIEWAPDVEKLPELFVKYVDEKDRSGGIDNIQRKLILTFARSFFRTIGGQHRAVDFIKGDTRTLVQNQVEQRLKESCASEGVIIRSFVIRSTDPPHEIREQCVRREVADRESERYEEEIKTQIGNVVKETNGKEKIGPDNKPVREGGLLAKVLQERRKDREKQFGDVRKQVAVEVRASEQYEGVETTIAERELAVAKIMLEAAKDRAARILAKGTAQAEVTVMRHRAEAEGVKEKVTAFQTGEKYAEYQLIKKLSPGIKRILSNTEGPFAKLFERFAALGEDDEKGGKKGSSD